MIDLLTWRGARLCQSEMPCLISVLEIVVFGLRGEEGDAMVELRA